MNIIEEKILIQDELKIVEDICTEIVNTLPSFNVTDKKTLPYGLKPHTRSVSWIVEQVITQQMQHRASELNLQKVEFNVPDPIDLHDCILTTKDGNKYYINIKIYDVDREHKSKNDIAAIKKLYEKYSVDSEYRLIYACFGIRFDNLTINFVKERVHIFSAQFLPIYVNHSNGGKLQARYIHTPEFRTRKDFLKELYQNS